jgi:hypothetical protein
MPASMPAGNEREKINADLMVLLIHA